MGVLIFVLRTALLRLCISEIMRPSLQWRHYDQLKIECHLKHPSPTSENMVYWPPEPFHQSEDRREFFYKNFFSKIFFIRKIFFLLNFHFSTCFTQVTHTLQKTPYKKSHVTHVTHVTTLLSYIIIDFKNYVTWCNVCNV